MVKCPHCDIGMREVSVRANPGTLIILDQCGRCGGIWCDKWELFPVEPEEAKRLDPVDETALKDSAALEEKPLYCPRCTAELQRFHDPLLPPGIQLQRCRRCEGIWLNRGQFGRYKNFQQKTRAEKMPEEERLRKLAEAYHDPRAWVTTGTQGMFAYPQGAAAGDDLKEAGKGAVRLILQTLLRLILGF
jgi:Zn-finger nucleic acid-binding protein